MYSALASVAIEQLASDYAGQPVIVLEYNVDNAPPSRLSRWFAGFGGENPSLPLTMVDSGDQIYDGYNPNVYSYYQGQVDYSLARPPLADLQATWARVGDQVRFSVSLTNLSGKTLSASNDATLHAIVYEENHIQYTNRFVRAAVATGINSLANGATGSYTLNTQVLDEVDWGRLHYIVLADYRPSASSGKYDMLQAAVASPASRVEPDELIFLVDLHDEQAVSQMSQIIGPAGAGWSASPGAAWVSVAPGSGALPTQPAITVSKHLLTYGWQAGNVSFSFAGGQPSDAITVRAYLGDLQRLYLPLVKR